MPVFLFRVRLFCHWRGLWRRAGVVFSISCPFGNGSRTDWGTDSVWHWQVWRFSTVGTHYETLFFYGETNPNLLPCLWQSRKKCRSNQPCDSSVPHLYRLCRGCHGAEYQPLSFVFAIGIVTWNTVLTGLGYYCYQYKDLFFHYFDKYKHVIFYTGIVLLVIFALNAIRKKRAARETNQEE